MAKNKPENPETPLAQAAFYQWLALGPSRTYRKLADLLGRPPGYVRAIEAWASRYDWQRRAKEYDAEELQKILDAEAKKRREEIEKMHARHIEIGVIEQKAAIKQIKDLIDAQAFGSLASVQLLKLAVEIERQARELPDTKIEISGQDGGPIIIKTVWGTPKIERKTDE